MATPHAAGLAALLLQSNRSATPAQIKQAFMSTALNMGASVALAGKAKKLEWVGVLGIGHQVEHRLIR
jgi:subtilisin family serine protease